MSKIARAVLCVGVAGVINAGCPAGDKGLFEEDRPIIIVENGSMKVHFEGDGGDKVWKKESQDKAHERYTQRHSNSKETLNLSATDGSCSVEASSILFRSTDPLYVFVLEIHKPSAKNHVDAVFAKGTDIDKPSGNSDQLLHFKDAGNIASFEANGMVCKVAEGGKVTVTPKHQ
jgi:hypothetical protein